MKIEGCTAIVTGGNRGIGLGFVEADKRKKKEEAEKRKWNAALDAFADATIRIDGRGVSFDVPPGADPDALKTSSEALALALDKQRQVFDLQRTVRPETSVDACKCSPQPLPSPDQPY